MAEPNTDARGRRIAASGTAHANFWRWYRGSKLVDAQGRPLLAVHLTNHEFAGFEHAARADAYRAEGGMTRAFGRDFVFPRTGFFFFLGDVPPRPHERIAVPAYLRICNPLDLRMGLGAAEASRLIDFVQEKVNEPPSPGQAGYRLRGEVVGGLRRARREGISGEQLWELLNLNCYAPRDVVFDDVLRVLGKDGLIFPSNSAGTYLGERARGPGDGLQYVTVVALSPHQIKSAVGNSGAFDPESATLCDVDLDGADGQDEAPGDVPRP